MSEKNFFSPCSALGEHIDGTEVQIQLFLILVLDGNSVTNFTLRPLCIRERTLLAINLSNTELNPMCHLLALLGAHRILHVSRVRVKQEAGWASENFSALQGREKSFPLPEFETRTLQAIVWSLYHCVILVYERKYMKTKRKAK